MTQQDALAIRLICLDVDGVLTDGSIQINDHGIETKRFHVRDGAGIRMWLKLGGDVAIITGRSGMAVQHRARELGIPHVMQGVRNKAVAFGELVTDLGLAASQAAVIGDDLPDLPMMRLAGYPVSVADGAREVREIAEFVTIRPGGHGAVREAVEHIVKIQDRWDEVLSMYDS